VPSQSYDGREIAAVAVQSDGAIVFAGTGRHGSTATPIVFRRLDGCAIDLSFSDDGRNTGLPNQGAEYSL
jgi:hypothetical protein